MSKERIENHRSFIKAHDLNGDCRAKPTPPIDQIIDREDPWILDWETVSKLAPVKHRFSGKRLD